MVLLQAVQASHQNLKNQNLSDQHGESSDTSKHVILTDGLRDVARADRVAPAAGNRSVTGRHRDVDGLEGSSRRLANRPIADRRHPVPPDGAVDGGAA